MSISKLLETSINDNSFLYLDDFIKFCNKYLNFISNPRNFQAHIVSQNEQHYSFYQYKEDGNFSITRPINSKLFYSINEFEPLNSEFLRVLQCARELNCACTLERSILNNSIYTIQQSIGATLDALPSNKFQVARKRNGDIFEKFIRIILKEIGIPCRSGIVKIPVVVDGETIFKMSYQHDLIIEQGNNPVVLGSIKTSSKDRMAKIFMDKFLYCKLTETSIPHIAIFLNDVQRKKPGKNKPERSFGINATFLPGHFKGYTIKLNPLDGVYYCDLRPNMLTENIIKDHIKSLDCLLCEDIWKLVDGVDFAGE